MDSKPDYPAYPTQPPDNTAPYAPTTAQSPTYPSGYIPPPGSAPLIEPPRELWFTVAKYYVLIVNWINCGLSALFAVILVLVGLFGLFTGYFGSFVGCILLAALFGLLSLYFYKVPIKGARDGMATRLTVHGVICGLFVLSALGSLAASDGQSTSTGDPRVDEFLQSYKRASTKIHLSRTIYGACEMLACFAMANLLHKERRMIWSSAYTA